MMPTETHSVYSHDGTVILYRASGQGPGVILLPGVLSTGDDYRTLSSALAKRFTVHVLERRGRGGSGPQGAHYSIERECEDLEAVSNATGSVFVFGHSYGGLVALEATCRMSSLTRVAVYEPIVSIDGSISADWIPEYRRHLANGQPLDAFTVFIHALGPQSARTAPRWWLKLLLGTLMSKAERVRRFELLEENLNEHREINRLDNTYMRYAEVSVELLLLAGKKSDPSTRYAVERLAQVNRRAEIAILPGVDHFGPTQDDPTLVADRLASFFSGDSIRRAA